MSTNSTRSLNTLSALALAENRITVRDACTETAHGHDAGILLHRATKMVCKALGCRASYCADCDLQVVLADGSTLDLNWDSGIDGYDYEGSTEDAELLQAAEDATSEPVAPVAPSPVEILGQAIVAAASELATWSTANATNTTTLDCRVEYFRINGMIDCLRILGGEDAIVGFRLPVKKAYEAAIPNCINIDALRVCTPR